MADNTLSVKKYQDYAQNQVDEQAILDKYNAATIAQYNLQREQNRQAENKFYNQMYNTQKTAMDTIRQSNAAAVSTGASRGIQAANELSALLGLQQESVESATELAQANRQTAQEETAAVLENVLNAYQQAQQERSNLVSQGIEAASVDVQNAANSVAAQQAQTDYERYLLDLKVNDPDKYAQVIAQNSNASDFTSMTEDQYASNIVNATTSIDELAQRLGYNYNDFAAWDWGEKGSEKYKKIQTDLRNLYVMYGLSEADADAVLNSLNSIVKPIAKQEGAYAGTSSKSRTNAMNQAVREYMQAQFKLAYAAKYNKQ